MLRKLVVAAAIVSGGVVAPGSPARGAAPAYAVDTVHSTAIFRVKHMNTSYAYGRFNNITGKFSIDDQDPAQSRFDFEVKTDSIDTGSAGRDKHLKSPDFFNAVQYPTITFKSKTVTKTGTDAYDVAGDLTLHGVTRSVVAKVTKSGEGKDMRGKAIAGFEAHLSLKRADFKMSNMMQAVGDDVEVTVSVEGGR